MSEKIERSCDNCTRRSLNDIVCKTCRNYTGTKLPKVQPPEDFLRCSLCNGRLDSEKVIIEQADEIKKLKFVISQFERWWSEECPYKMHNICPCIDELKKEFEENHEDGQEFDVLEECNHSTFEGYCWVKYYESLFKGKQ